MSDVYLDIIIPTYVINIPERTDRFGHIQLQFDGRSEFDLMIVDACKHSSGAVALWQSILKIIKIAISKEDDVIIICDDSHEFTKDYSKIFLLENIMEAANQGVEILSGGIGNFYHAVPITKNRLWIDSLCCTQFIIVYKSLFEKILEEPFEDVDTVSGKLSEITSHKMILFPFISKQKIFGNLNVRRINQPSKITIEDGFEKSERRLDNILKIKEIYCKRTSC